MAATLNDREKGHAEALRCWSRGDYRAAQAEYTKISQVWPRDMLALQIGHQVDYFLGDAPMLRDRIAGVLPDWDDAVPGFGFVVGMYAFGLEEMREYGRAEREGRRAVAMNPRDPWAIHAVAHVMEMQGRSREGLVWLDERVEDWSAENMLARHVWWHRALFCLDLEDVPEVLRLYDTRVRPKAAEMALELVDATALLWRLHLRGVELGTRWNAVADEWAPLLTGGYYAFNDIHAMMALVGAGRMEMAGELLARVRAAADGPGTNAAVTRLSGLAAVEGIYAFGLADYAGAVAKLEPVRHSVQSCGGSHAQRDVVALTLIEAAIRGGLAAVARRLANERVSDKPSSPLNWGLLARAADLANDIGTAKVAAAKANAVLLPA
ncbi:tetratricopeptide repeat protein [Lacibacterium aquatile]|uniref:Tetratricopeptide repeat protein 38 n=1 Tax=Lacibacterium aquatile TaxID=1168082 RepID=A0ABW5DWD9_9PROT